MRSEKGVGLIEVMVAIALMGIVFVTYTGALYTASKAVSIADERAVAESLARTQMEYVRSQLYSEAPWNYTVCTEGRSSTDPPERWYDADSNPPLLDSSYAGYSVSVSAEGLIEPGIDNEIQKLTVTVAHQDGTGEITDIITLEGYRSMR
jgi:prepilin-type N-terminal cleavage/methylation domain-containing protein